MLQISERAIGLQNYTTTVTLTFERRQRTRQRLLLDDGREAALLLPRGTVLRGGDYLHAREWRGDRDQGGKGRGIQCLLFAIRCNWRGRPIIWETAMSQCRSATGWLRYLRDHVLDHMLEEMGLQVRADTVAFEPEAGAYHSHD